MYEKDDFDKRIEVKTETDTHFSFVFKSSDHDNKENIAKFAETRATKWNSFDEYVDKAFGTYWEVNAAKNADDWKTSSSCTCPFFQKNWKCKHVIAVVLRKGVVLLPSKGISAPLGQKPKRGRKPNATPALVMQDNTQKEKATKRGKKRKVNEA